MSINSLPAQALTYEEASIMEEHLLRSTHHLIDLEWAIQKQWNAEIFTTTDVRQHLYAARDALNEACSVLESAQADPSSR